MLARLRPARIAEDALEAVEWFGVDCCVLGLVFQREAVCRKSCPVNVKVTACLLCRSWIVLVALMTVKRRVWEEIAAAGRDASGKHHLALHY